MATNQTIESPNYEKISKEAGQFTADAINLLWAALNDTRATERRDVRRATEIVAPKFISLTAAASVNDLDLEGSSVVSFIGADAHNFTGMRAPETGQTRIVFVQVNGTGTITVKNNATSEAANRIITSIGGDLAMTQGTGMIFVYLAGNWKEVASTRT